MKVTPLEIRQKAFEKKLRGYDKDEVNAYMQSLSQEWERLIEENKELRARLENAEKDVQRLREVEASLFKTLKTAEDTGANMIDQANKAAGLQVKEAQMQSDAMLNDARNQARNLMEEAESRVRERLENAKDQIRLLEADCKLIDNHRDNLLIELKGLANDTIDRVEKLKTKQSQSPILESKNLDLDSGAISFDDLQHDKPIIKDQVTIEEPVINKEPELEEEQVVEDEVVMEEPIIDEEPEMEAPIETPNPVDPPASNEVIFEIENSNKMLDEDTISQINEEVSNKSIEEPIESEVQDNDFEIEDSTFVVDEPIDEKSPQDEAEVDVPKNDIEDQSDEKRPEEVATKEVKKDEGTGSFFDSI